MNRMSGRSKALGFRSRLTLSIIGLVLVSVVLIASLVYIQYRQSYTQATVNRLQGTGEMMAESFKQWLDARQDEVRYITQLDGVKSLDLAQINHFLKQIADLGGYYDTIFLVSPEGQGLAGVRYDSQAQILSEEEANAFQVADRAWFQRAMTGEPVFSKPLVSRATGHRVSNVVLPVYSEGEIVGVLRAAVALHVLVERMETLSAGKAFDTYLLSAQGTPVTPVAALQGETRDLKTEAAEAIASGDSGIGQYLDPAGEPVIGSYSYLPRLDWGVVLEVPVTQALAEVNRLFWVLVGLTGVILVLALAFSLGLVRSVVRTLGGDPQMAADVVRQVADGDLSTRVPVKAGDTSSLLANIDGMQVNLQKMLRDIVRYSDEVAASATELAEINGQTESGVDHQSEQVNSVAVSMNEMTSTVEEVARNTQDTADNARETTTEAASGREVVESAITAIQNLAQEVGSSADVVKQLKLDSDEIGTVLQIIRDVADQTNLLALNAAIEAARAGDDGRGFAVVADEVRTLASRTQSSAAQIQETVETLQDRADQATRVMDGSVESANQGVEHVNSAGDSLNKITRSVSRIDDMASQIATATEEQTATAQDINERVQSVSTITDQTARNVEQSKQAGDSLAQLAEELRGMVKRFRI